MTFTVGGWTGKYSPDYALTDRLVDILRADTILNLILFSETAPVHPLDYRVYTAYVELPTDPPLRSQFPRVLVEAVNEPVALEQVDPNTTLGNVNVWIHVVAPAINKQMAEQLEARATYTLASTPLSTPSILANGLVPNGSRLPTREADGKWRITRQYRAHLVGVLA